MAKEMTSRQALVRLYAIARGVASLKYVAEKNKNG